MKKLIVTAIATSVLIVVCTCVVVVGIAIQPGGNDWSYELPNNYVIWRINSEEIVCGKKESEYSIDSVGGDYITEFCYNEQYVCIKCVDPHKEMDKQVPMYYIIDTKTDNISDMLSEEEYSEDIIKYDTTEISQWIHTCPAPEGAEYPY